MGARYEITMTKVEVVLRMSRKGYHHPPGVSTSSAAVTPLRPVPIGRATTPVA